MGKIPLGPSRTEVQRIIVLVWMFSYVVSLKTLPSEKPDGKNISWSKGKKSTTHPRCIDEKLTHDLNENMTFQSLDFHALNQS